MIDDIETLAARMEIHERTTGVIPLDLFCDGLQAGIYPHPIEDNEDYE